MPRKGENIYRRKDGRWEGRFPKGRVDGKSRFGYVFGHSYQETKEKLVKAKVAWQTDSHENMHRKETLASISAMWLAEAGHFLKESTAAKYQELLDYYILPTFGTKPIASISNKDIEAFVHFLTFHGGKKKQGLAVQTVSEILRILGAIKSYALRMSFTVKYSLEKLPAKRHQKPLRVFSEVEWKYLRSYLFSKSTPIHAGVLIAMLTGIRIGELCALRWEDISLTEKQLRIHQTLQRIRIVSGEKKSKIIITSPKSDSGNRIIPLSEDLCEYLAPLYHEGAFLLTGKEDSPSEPRNMRKNFKSILKQCKITPSTFHTLRHTFATRCVEAGVDPKCLSSILGHADVSVTFNRYVHPTMATKRKNMKKFLEFSSK